VRNLSKAVTEKELKSAFLRAAQIEGDTSKIRIKQVIHHFYSLIHHSQHISPLKEEKNDVSIPTTTTTTNLGQNCER
jgi:hypothetical protein